LRAHIRESAKSLVDPVYRQQLRDTQLDHVAAPELGGFVGVCVFGLIGMAICAWILLFMDPSEGFGNALQLGIGIGGLVLVWGLIGLVPACLAEKRYVRLGVVAVLTVLVAGGLAYRWRADQGTAVPGDELLTYLDKQSWDSEVYSLERRLGKRRSGHRPQHRLEMGTENGRVSSFTFGSEYPPLPYTGTLPFGLRAGDQPGQVRDKLGPPDSEAEPSGKDDTAEWFYRKHGLTVRFLHGGLNTLKVLAPSITPAPPLSAEQLLALPGTDYGGAEMRAFRKTFKPGYLRDQGAEEQTASDGKINSVVLRAPYRGELPGKIRFGEPQAEVRRKLGAPSQPGQFEDTYTGRGILLGYDSSGRLERVTITRAKMR
jgi:hypothetical protein